MRLQIDSLTKSFGSKKVLEQLNLTLDEPGIWALIAPNGAGKTTLLDCIANLQEADSGKIHILGKEHGDPSIYRSFAYLQDNRILYPELTGLEHLQLVQKIHGLSKERLEEVIDEIGIASYVKSRVKSYSLGMKQHLLLALAIMHKPKLILLDEPLNGLDPTSYIETRKLLKNLADQGATIIVSSHQLNEVDLLTNKLLFLKDGRLIQKEVKDRTTDYRINTSDNHEVMRLLGDSLDLELQENSIKCDSSRHSLNEVLRAILACPVEVYQVSPVEKQAEEIYQELFE